MALFGGVSAGICQWALIVGPQSDEDMDGFVAHIEALGRVTQPNYLVLDLAHSISLPTPLQREAIANAVTKATGASGAKIVVAHALVTNSMTARGVLTAVNWFVERSFEEKVFGEPRAALAWLATFNPKLDPASVLADIERAAPLFARLRW